MQLLQRKYSLKFCNCYHANIRFLGEKIHPFIQTFLNIYSNFVIDIDILRSKCFDGTNFWTMHLSNTFSDGKTKLAKKVGRTEISW